MNVLIDTPQSVFVSRNFLMEQGIPEKSLENWSMRNSQIKKVINGTVYFQYFGIPAPSRSKLPPPEELVHIAQQQEKNQVYEYYKQIAETAILRDFGKVKTYLEGKYINKIDEKHLNTIAKKWCVCKAFFEKRVSNGENEHMRQVLNDLFNNWFSSREAYSRNKNKIKLHGLEAALVHYRLMSREGRFIKFTPAMQQRFMYYFKDDRKFSIPEIRKIMIEHDGFKNMPSEQILKKHARKLLKDPAILKLREGAKKAQQARAYQKLTPPEFVHSQWQIDGWTLPYYTLGTDKEGKEQKFQRWVLIRVIDVCSRKILAATVAQSETGHEILKTLENAVRETSCLPMELVMDMHAGTKLQDFGHFKIHAERLGCKVIISHNATDKAVIERYNSHLNSLAKYYPEWLGEGIAAKNPKRRSAETMRELAKKEKHISEDETIARGKILCQEFNATRLKTLGTSPELLYEKAQKSGIPVTETKIAAMFTPAKEYTVSRGMITIQRGSKRNVYSLPIDLYQKWNGEMVMVHTFDIDECIYLFDMVGNFITNLPPDNAINTSITERGKDEKPKALGISKATQSKADKDLEGLINNPESAAFIPSYAINKDAYSAIQQSEALQQFAKVEGLKVEKKHKPIVHIPGETKYNLNDPELNNDEMAILPPSKDFFN